MEAVKNVKFEDFKIHEVLHSNNTQKEIILHLVEKKANDL